MVYLILCYVIMCNCGCITCCACVHVYKDLSVVHYISVTALFLSV